MNNSSSSSFNTASSIEVDSLSGILSAATITATNGLDKEGLVIFITWSRLIRMQNVTAKLGSPLERFVSNSFARRTDKA